MSMATITIALDDDLLQASRDHAQRHQLSLNALICDLLISAVARPRRIVVDECLSHLETAGGDSRGQRWKRGELYDD
jgi:hypothetical protein